MIRTLLQMFWSFCQIGFTSFGGMSMIPLINAEMVNHGWMTAGEVSDIVAIAEMTPGPVGLNCATFAGMRVVGVVGSIVCVIGMLMPTFTICAAAAVFFERFKHSTILKNLMIGVRPASIGILFAVMVSLGLSNYTGDTGVSLGAIAIGLLSAYLLIRRKWNVPLVITLSAILGLLL